MATSSTASSSTVVPPKESWSSRARRLIPMISTSTSLSSLINPFAYPLLQQLLDDRPPTDPGDLSKESTQYVSPGTCLHLLIGKQLSFNLYLLVGPITIHRAIHDAHIILTANSPILPSTTSTSGPSDTKGDPIGSETVDTLTATTECHMCGNVRQEVKGPPSYITPILGLRNGLPVSDCCDVWLEPSPSNVIPNQPKSSTQTALEELMIPLPPSSSIPSTPSTTLSSSSTSGLPSSLATFMNAILPPAWPLPAEHGHNNIHDGNISRSVNHDQADDICECLWNDVYAGVPIGTFGHGVFHRHDEYASANDSYGRSETLPLTEDAQVF
jgi:hypothetical protein